MKPAIAINGKFLGAPLNGVHRTAALYTRELFGRTSPTGAEIVVPASASGLATVPPEISARARIASGPFGGGQGWEMLTLPWATRKQLLLSFCNLAPLLHPRSVVMIHDAQTFLYPSDYTGRQAAAYRRLLPLIARRAVRVLTVSNFSKRSLAECGVVDEAKVEVVHNGTDHILETPPDETILDRLGLRGRAYALTMGSTKRYKNMERLFAAFSHGTDLPLVVAGGPKEEAYADGYGSIPEGTVFTGRVSDGELRALYAGARMFLFPSRTEGFGLPPVEAMQCGCPVVAADAGAMPEVCGEAAILVGPEDTEGWAKAIRELNDDDGLRAKLLSHGRERAERFTWKAAGARLLEAIGDLQPAERQPGS